MTGDKGFLAQSNLVLYYTRRYISLGRYYLWYGATSIDRVDLQEVRVLMDREC